VKNQLNFPANDYWGDRITLLETKVLSGSSWNLEDWYFHLLYWFPSYSLKYAPSL